VLARLTCFGLALPLGVYTLGWRGAENNRTSPMQRLRPLGPLLIACGYTGGATATVWKALDLKSEEPGRPCRSVALKV